MLNASFIKGKNEMKNFNDQFEEKGKRFKSNELSKEQVKISYENYLNA